MRNVTPGPLRLLARDERGSIAILGAAAILVFAMLGGAVIEVGQWFQHRRNLQVRTDAAALGGGQALSACFNIGTAQFPNEQAADDYIENWAKNYGGFRSPASTQTGAPYNRQFGTGTSYMSFQSDTFPSAGNLKPTRNLHNECFVDGDPTHTDPSNVNLMADVRTTQSGISPFFSFSPFATTHGWARVQLQAIKSLKPTMPLAIPDVRPSHVAVTFVDNSTGQALTCAGAPIGTCTFPLGSPTPSGTLTDWTGRATIPMPAAGSNVGIRVSIGNADGNCAGINAVTTAGGTNYVCYDYSNTGQAAKNGILAIRSYDSTGVGTIATPKLRDVTPVSCSGTPYFSVYQATNGACTVSVLANVDFGSGADLTQAQVTGTIKALGGGGNGIAITLGHTTGNQWASTPISLPTRGGPYTITLKWKYGTGGGNGTDFNGGNPVQQIFSGSDGSDSTLPGGPIFAASVSDLSGNAAYSRPAGAPATVAVTIGLTGGVHINPKCPDPAGKNVGAAYVCATDPTAVLRAANTSGSLNYAINCGVIPGNPGSNNPLYQMIRFGCRDSFSINQPDVCPDTVTTPTPNPTDCAPVQQVTGDKVGPVQKAMNDRLAPGGKCVANNYPNTSDPADPRIMRLVDTDFSAFNGNGGNTTVPVITFATFYITGWDGANSSCTSPSAPLNEPAPPNAISNGNSADIWGHFIKDDTDGTPSGLKCAVTDLAPCVPALVR